MYIEPNINRLKTLRNITADDIGKQVMFCSFCDFQLDLTEAANCYCPVCGERFSIITVDKELLSLIFFGKFFLGYFL
jgi:hypothetical protein